jgi:signal transduction histidine kinase
VDVALTRADDTVSLTITDDGRGFEIDHPQEAVEHSSPVGLASIRERAIMLHGECSIHSNKGNGTSVRVVIPLAQASDE